LIHDVREERRHARAGEASNGSVRANAGPADPSLNHTAAGMFRQCADLLSTQGANPFRVNAYRRAATTLESLTTDVREILHTSGVNGLIELPAIGAGRGAG
jgi:hypothetical protein